MAEPAAGAKAVHDAGAINMEMLEQERELARKQTIEDELPEMTPLDKMSSLNVDEFPAKLTDRSLSAPPVPESTSTEGKNTIAVFTSGGDAPGMNAAVRGVVATSLNHHLEVYGINNGYKGMVDGDIEKLGWSDIEGIISKGGTIIGSCRFPEFSERKNRLEAVKNLVKFGITDVVCIGGDGTLTGANVLKNDWPGLVSELAESGQISAEQAEKHAELGLVGIVASIDNDMCGFSMTIGCDTALHRIVTAVDALITTAESHQRTFIVEVMGKNCGFLSLMAGMACAADWVFVPESPPEYEDWEAVMCKSLSKRRSLNYSLIILAEGATDRVRRPITAEYLKKILSENIGHDTRITTLGHVQRGGSPSAYDRVVASRLGAEAVLTLINQEPSMPASIVGVRLNKIVQVDLKTSVAKNDSLRDLLQERRFPEALEIRGPTFKEEFEIYRRTRRLRRDESSSSGGRSFRIAILHAGSPASGMNAATKTFTRDFINGGHTVLGIREGFLGLMDGTIEEFTWDVVAGWTQLGGSMLGTRRGLPNQVPNGIQRCAEKLKEHRIDALIVIGGYEGFQGLAELKEGRASHPSLCIPMMLIPATITNNVPGSDFSLGSDTALNAITVATDRLKQSATSSRRRIMLVQTFGGYCGYLATMGALAGGADGVFTWEEGLHLKDIDKVVTYARKKFTQFQQAIFLRAEKCNVNLSIEILQAILEEAGRGDPDHPDAPHFTVRNNILGHLQQGLYPSPLDRVRACRMSGIGGKTLKDKLQASLDSDGKVFTTAPDSVFVVGYRNTITETPFEDLEARVDDRHRLPQHQWSTTLATLVRMLANNTDAPHEYKSVAVRADFD